MDTVNEVCAACNEEKMELALVKQRPIDQRPCLYILHAVWK